MEHVRPGRSGLRVSRPCLGTMDFGPLESAAESRAILDHALELGIDVTAPIVGPRTLKQRTSSLQALELRLSADALQRLHRTWPGPGGPAPEAHAW